MTKTDTFKYTGISVQQTPESAPFYLISCTADELLKWSDVPRKKEEFMAGYQRDLSNRHETISAFFREDPKHNIIPNAVIVAVRSDAIQVNDKNGALEIVINKTDTSDLDAAKKLLEEFEARLNDEELASINIDDDGEEEREDEIDEITPPDSYMASIVKVMRTVVGEDGEQKLSSLPALKEYLHGAIKPGLILDGQHRVWGAKNVSEFEVQLPVVILPGLSPEEQVFHFYVLNNKAKPLNKTELRSIVSTSLSKKEIGQLYDRFKQAGVASEQAEWTYKMNTDESSPFKGLIDFGLSRSTSTVIPENVAYQVVTKFMNLGSKYRMLTEGVSGWNSTDVVTKTAHKLSCFYGFWSAVKAKYTNAWNSNNGLPRRQILQKVSLLKLQEFVLDKLVADMPRRNQRNEQSPLADPCVLTEEVTLALTFLSEEFFTKEWKLKGLDTGAGHTLFLAELEKAFNNQSRNLGNQKLFKLQA